MPATVNQGELDVLLDILPRETAVPRRLEDPLMPFETHLQLTREQEERLIQHVMVRYRDMVTELGREAAMSEDSKGPSAALPTLHALGLSSRSVPFLVRRALFYNHFYNDYEDRVQEGTIYANSNVTASLSPRVTQQVFGRLKNTLFGSSPWFTAEPVGEADEELARKVREFCRYKSSQAGFLAAIKTAIDMACIVGETVIKTTFVDERLWFWRKSPILVNARGEPRFDSQGNYIFQEDRFVPEMAQQQDDPNQAPVLAPTGRAVLRKDNTVVLDPTDTWEVRRVRVGDSIYKGVRSQEVRFTDFLCPLNASSVHDADIICHVYDKPAMEVASWFLQGRFSYLATQEEVAVRADRAMKLLRDISAASGSAAGDSDSILPRTVHGEQDAASPGSSGMINVIEAWLRYDADEDGIQEEIVILIDPRTMLPLYYEYTGMATDDRRRPFTVQRVLPVYGRWYGQGVMEYLEPEQQFLDLLVNRINMATSQSGTVKFWDPSKTVEGLNDPNLKLNSGETYRLTGEAQAEDVIKVVEVYNEKHIAHLRELFNLFMQLLQLKTGVISAGDESFQDIQSAKLATGIRSLEKSGNELFASWLQETSSGVKGTLEKFAKVTLMHLDERETWEFTEGGNKVLTDLSRDDVHGLRVNVEMALGGDEGERFLASAAQVFGMMRELISFPPETAQGLRSIVVDCLRSLKISYPEEKIVLPMAIPGMVGGEPGDQPGTSGGGSPAPAPAAVPDAF